MRLIAFTAVCEEDRAYAPQYIKEAERLNLEFVIHFDKCSRSTIQQFQASDLFKGSTQNDDPAKLFSDADRQGIFDLASRFSTRLLSWDVDETWERDFRTKWSLLDKSFETVLVRVAHLWDSKEHVRSDAAFQKVNPIRRRIFSNENGQLFRYTAPCIASPSLLNVLPGDSREIYSDITCVHWGFLTAKDRLKHKNRWDRLFNYHMGRNPYGFWNFICDEESYPAETTPHNLFEITK